MLFKTLEKNQEHSFSSVKTPKTESFTEHVARNKTSLGCNLLNGIVRKKAMQQQNDNLIHLVSNTAAATGVFFKETQRFAFQAKPGRRYSVACWTEKGAVGEIGKKENFSPTQGQFKLKQRGGYLCHTFEERQEVTRYVRVCTNTVRTEFRIMLVEADMTLPEWLHHQLFPALGEHRKPTSNPGIYGGLWGNYARHHNPFYKDFKEFVHQGYDDLGKVGQTVFAMYDGEVVEAKDWGNGWGWYVLYKSQVDGNTITFLTGHLQFLEGKLHVGQKIERGQPIGSLCKIVGWEKEPTHGHVGAHLGEPRFERVSAELARSAAGGPATSSAGATHVSRFGLGDFLDLGNPDAYQR